MQFSKVAAATILAFTGTCLAATHSGAFTYYYPGAGACGHDNSDDDMVVAVSHLRFDSEKDCGRKISATHGGQTVEVTVVDRCSGCAYDDLDFSPAAFGEMAELAEGKVKGTWYFA